jgi:cytochrome c oxidase subunit 4
MAEHALEHPHGTSGKYIQVAIILFTLTALEVLLYEVCFGGLSHSMSGLSGTLEPWFVEVLLLLSFLKFWYVAMFYMHLKFDMKLLSWLFLFSLIIAAVVILALIALFVYNRGLWWPGGPW